MKGAFFSSFYVMNKCLIGLWMIRMTGRQRKRFGSRIARFDMHVQVSLDCLIRSEWFADILVNWSINFFAVVGRFICSKMAVILRILQFNYSRRAFSRLYTFAIVIITVGHCGVYMYVCICMCVCASVASTRVEIVAGGKKSKMDADYAAILTN